MNFKAAFVIVALSIPICADEPQPPRWLDIKILGENPNSPKTLDLEGVIKLAEKTTGGVDEFIPQLPAELRGFAEEGGYGMSLAYLTRSPRPASATQPRVIVWAGPYLTLAFDGVSQVVEAQEYRPETRSWEFVEIDFSSSERVKRNPESCRGCHGQALKPNWRAYPLWEGFFGSKHGTRDIIHRREGELFEAFAQQRKLPRYTALSLPSFKELSDSNVALTNRLAEQNAHRIAHQLIAATDNHPQWLASVAATLLLTDLDSAQAAAWREDFQKHRDLVADDEFYAQLLPPSHRKKFLEQIKSVETELRRNIIDARQKQDLIRQSEDFRDLNIFDLANSRQSAHALYIFGRLMGLQVKDWTLNYFSPAWTMSDGREGTLKIVRDVFFREQWRSGKLRDIIGASSLKWLKARLLAMSCEVTLTAPAPDSVRGN